MLCEKCGKEHISYEAAIAREKMIKGNAILVGALAGVLINLILRALCMGVIATTVLCFSVAVAILNEINEALYRRTGIDLEESHTAEDKAFITKIEIACIIVTIAAGLFVYPLFMA